MGGVARVYGDLVEIGVDAVNSQLFTMNIEELAKKYRGKITFWGEINRYTLFLGGVQDVIAAVKRVKNTLYDPRGGVIAQCEWGKDNPVENVRAVYETWYQ